tara:strand:+ start:85 stop:549 length:465 start_codon:yes stop_codon:yes gene_type:complete
MNNSFINLSIVEGPNYNILYFVVLDSQPTPLSWEEFIKKFRLKIDELNKNEKPYAFLLDIRKLGMLGIKRIKDFIKVLTDNEKNIEEKVICSTVILEGRAVKALCGIFLTFYKTKKPLHFYKNKEECAEKILEIYQNKNESAEGIDYTQLCEFE